MESIVINIPDEDLMAYLRQEVPKLINDYYVQKEVPADE